MPSKPHTSQVVSSYWNTAWLKAQRFTFVRWPPTHPRVQICVEGFEFCSGCVVERRTNSTFDGGTGGGVWVRGGARIGDLAYAYCGEYRTCLITQGFEMFFFVLVKCVVHVCFMWRECVAVGGSARWRKALKVARDADVDFMVEVGGEPERMTARECVELACESGARREWAR